MLLNLVTTRRRQAVRGHNVMLGIGSTHRRRLASTRAAPCAGKAEARCRRTL